MMKREKKKRGLKTLTTGKTRPRAKAKPEGKEGA